MNEDGLHVVIGSGALGACLVRELVASGKRVRVVNRSGRADVPPMVEIRIGDAMNKDSILTACEGAKVIYHCANVSTSQWSVQLVPIMEGVIHAATREEALVVYADNLYAYGRPIAPLNEKHPTLPDTRKGKLRADVVELLMDAHRSGRIRAVIGSAPDFYGPGVLNAALGTRVFGAALQGRPAAVLGDIDTMHSYMYIRDFAHGLMKLAEEGSSWGQKWHIPANEAMTTRQWITRIYQHAGANASFRVAPRLWLRLVGLVHAETRELNEMLYVFEQPFVIDSGKYVRKFGYQATPHEQAIRETMKWFQEHRAVWGSKGK